MRLTCPNCGAQYEVPDEVIPTDGRDVQCSNCGDTWFQEHPDYPVEDDVPAQAPSDADGPDVEEYSSEPSEPPAQAPDPTPTEPPPGIESVQQKLGASITDVLRQEADHEAKLRAAENLESQPDLGLENASDDASHRAEEARARMMRMRGEEPPEPVAGDLAASLDSRRGLLPNIEDINSSLKTADQVATRNALSTFVEDEPTQKKSGFSRGFTIAILIAAACLLVYKYAPAISQAIPQVDPFLNTYVAWFDQARLWLDTQIGNLIPK